MEATLASGVELRSASRRFHLWMAAVFVLIAFSGFTPTYWARLANGTSHVPPIVHIHGILMFSWTLFYFIQTAWIAAARTATHRAWGLAGISRWMMPLGSATPGVGSRWSHSAACR